MALIQQNISKLFGLGSTVQFLNGRGSDGWVECCGGGGGDGPDQNKLQKKNRKSLRGEMAWNVFVGKRSLRYNQKKMFLRQMSTCGLTTDTDSD